MRAILTTCWGLENITADEIRERLRGEVELNPFGFRGRVAISIRTIEEAILLSYSLRTIHRCMLLLHSFKIRTDEGGLEDIYEGVKEAEFTQFLSPDVSFAIRSERKGEHRFISPQIAASAGQAVIDKVMEKKGYRQKVNLDDPDVTIRVDVSNDNCMVCLDMVGGESMHRRGWRRYDHPASLKGSIASALVRISGWDEGETMLDPLCGSGTIPIEAAHTAMDLPPGYFRKDNLAFMRLPFKREVFSQIMAQIDGGIRWGIELRIYGSELFEKHVEGAIMNAHSAGVEDKVKIYRHDVSALSELFRPGSVDVIVTNPPYGMRIADVKRAAEIHRSLLRSGFDLLREGGRMVLVTTHKNLIFSVAENLGFKIDKSLPICNGNLWIRAFKLIKGMA
ncbi:TPA: class I SAM-dependent RNA methyltransferase [Candidatus Poribacteria bacterium]|nr:class I SAM-dependent RNA methyltransferase [Candidatus Poribacteria bacterium]HEX28485.1 class I SAM-dependent RNA methyltransferase [Candidatus Poribacteria bacterium]